MHEQFHEQPTKRDSNGEPYKNLPGDMRDVEELEGEANYHSTSQQRARLIESVAAPMRHFALSNPCRTHDELNAAIESGNFAQMIRVGNTYGIGILLTVSPGDDELDEMFWHCSMSIISLHTFRPKTLQLWNKAERYRIKTLLTAFFTSFGVPGSEQFIKTKTALHIQKNLTSDELMQVYAEAK